MIRSALINAMLIIAPEYYEKRMAKRFGVGYPDYFDSTKSIFIHIPKAAGSSVGMALYGRQIPHHRCHIWRAINPRKFKSYFKFATIREPVSRFVSAFYYLKRGGMNEQDRAFGETALGKFSSADSFAKALVDSDQQSKILGWIHFRPQSYFIADSQGNSMMDMTFRFETVQTEFSRMAKRVGREGSTLPMLNVNNDKPQEELTASARDVIACLYRQDFQLWQNCDY